MSDQASSHPTAETMTAFIDGTLPRPELATVTQHLAGCEDCRAVVSETAQFEREEEQLRTNERRVLSKWWLVAAAAACVAILSIPLMMRFGREQSPVAILLDAAPRGHRIVEPRLAGFPWARLQAPQRGSVAPDPANLKLGGAAGTVLEQTAGQTSPASRHGTGLANLFIGRSSDAIAALEQATRGSGTASAWNDLAAARYVAAITDERAAQLPLALAAADQALRLEPRLAEALFNRALILERMELRDQARAAWQKYLAVDSASGWALEAREHMRRLDERSEQSDFPAALQRASLDPPRAIDELVRTYPRDARAWAEGPLLAEWADAERAGDHPKANERLALVRNLAAALVRISGEGFAADAVAAIERSSGDARGALVDGHRLFRAARIDYSRRRPAHDQFRAAEMLFRRGGSPMADLASYYAASTLLDSNEGAAAHDALRAIASRLPGRHRALAAQVRWELALCASIAGDWGTTLREADAASATFTALGEQTNVAAVDGIAAYALERMGATDLAWSRRIRAIAALRGDAQRIRRASIVHGAALGLEATDRTAAAEAVVDLLLDERDNPNVNLRTIAFTDRARLAGHTGNAALARSSLDRARSTAARLEDAGLRDMAVARIDLGEAMLLGRTDPRAALPAFDRVIAWFTARAGALLPDAYLQRARAHKAAGDARAAASDYAAALEEVGRQRRSARDGDVYIAFADTAGQIAEESIELHLARGDVTAALDVAERLPALLRADAPRTAARAPLPAEVVAIRYLLLRDQLAIFCVSDGGVAARSVPIDRQQLSSLVAQFADRVRRRAPVREIESDGAALYALLVAPLGELLAGRQELVVIPDRELHIVPFAALYDERQRQYLIDRYTIRIAPSVAGAAPIAGRELTPAVVIADPATPLGPRLPASRREAEQIAAMHEATLIRGEEATVAQFSESAGINALIHYGGHADSDFREAYGALLLSPSGPDRGILGSSEIARLSLPHHPLVVLAACGTARGEAVHIAGMSTLARAFLDAGARAVVGTLWEIDDDVAGPLFLRIHERLRDGLPPARAVREAQTALLRSTDERLAHPATWAAVAVISNSQQP